MEQDDLERLYDYLGRTLDCQGPPFDQYNPVFIVASVQEFLHAADLVLTGNGLATFAEMRS